MVSGNVRRRFDNGQEYPGAQSGRDSNSISHDHDVSDIDSGPARAAVRDDGDASAPNFDADGFAGPPEFPDREIAVLPCRGVAGFDIGRVIAAEDAYHADNGIAESDDEASDHDDDGSSLTHSSGGGHSFSYRPLRWVRHCNRMLRVEGSVHF